MSDGREDRIRERAHELWQREGSPEGREQDHWQQAEREIDAETTGEGETAGEPAQPSSRVKKGA